MPHAATVAIVATCRFFISFSLFARWLARPFISLRSGGVTAQAFICKPLLRASWGIHSLGQWMENEAIPNAV
jgi:hypothetical protein